MEKIFLGLVLLISAAILVLPMSVAASDSSEITWHGYLIDTDSVKLVGRASALDYVQNYDRQTALSAKSQTVGYMLYAGNWYHLDKHGSELAFGAIKRSDKNKGFYVTVSGKSKGDTIVVTAIN